MKLKKFLTLTRAGIIESLQFRLGTLVIIAGNLLYLIVVYFLWKAIYTSAGTPVDILLLQENESILTPAMILCDCII